MIKTKNVHMVPQAVIDCAENISKSGRIDDLYLLRIEAIRDYCNQVVKQYENKRALSAPKPKLPKKKIQNT